MNTISPVNYDVIAPKYDARYAQNPLAGVSRELRELVTKSQARDVLEVGCGTGHWVIELHPLVRRIVGLDFSFGMLEQARAQNDTLLLTNGDANHLPFPSARFDLVLSINALQHYTDQRAFITEARRILRADGALAIVNLDPHIGRDQWYLYDYFEGVKAADFRRFPSSGTLLDWMLAAGFVRAEWRVAEHIHQEFIGHEVLDNPFTQKNGSSQLALLSDAAYTAGLDRIHAAIASTGDTPPIFVTDQWLTLLVGWNH
ncbi:MAG: class I SAM-dependent methyltransferase [Anaerolineae bacterium]|nr:class I SAM-dependent methyltransferase [Anaerolineae bacterium]MCI0609168.1 class I SAM-dependent methyltransferase [Anaerolineae bacterium]